MTLANTFYQEVYEDVLSADAEWVVLQNPAMSSTDEYNAPRVLTSSCHLRLGLTRLWLTRIGVIVPMLLTIRAHL